MATISNNDIARAIYLASKEDAHAEQFFQKVVDFLYKRRLMSQVPDILLRLDKIINADEGRVVAKISSRNNLSEKIKKEIIHILSKRYSAKEIKLVSNLDEKLLGGFKVEVNDEIIDLTIKNKIDKLQEYITRNHE